MDWLDMFLAIISSKYRSSKRSSCELRRCCCWNFVEIERFFHFLITENQITFLNGLQHWTCLPILTVLCFERWTQILYYFMVYSLLAKCLREITPKVALTKRIIWLSQCLFTLPKIEFGQANFIWKIYVFRNCSTFFDYFFNCVKNF